MTREDENIAVIVRWFDEVWNQGREETIDELYAADGVAWGLGTSYAEGPEAFKQLYRLFQETLTDIKSTVDDVFAEGDRVAMRGTLTMTHRATGKEIELRGGGIAHIHEGKITQAWNSWDFMGVLVQLDVLAPDALVEALTGGA